MNTFLTILLVVSLVLNAALVIFVLSFRRDAKRARRRMADFLGSGGRHKMERGLEDRPLAQINAELGGLMNALESMLEDRRRQGLPYQRLTAAVDRDIRAPLNVLTAEIKAQRERALTDGARDERLEGAYREACLTQRMAGEVFELATLESEDERLALAHVNLNGVIRDAVAACYQDFIDSSVTPTVELPETPVTVMGNSAAIERVLHNLLINALRHGCDGGTIAVSLREDGEKAYVSVKDCGKGIAPEDLPFVFDRLYPADKARGGTPRGAGLGMAIARQLVMKQNGEITVQSASGTQTVFTFSLLKA